MKFQILGPLAVRRDDVPLPLGPAKQRSILTALLLEPNRVVPLDRLISTVWDGDPPQSAVANVRTYVSRLRGLLADASGSTRVTGQPPGYTLSVLDGELDLDVFRRLVHGGRAALAAGDAPRAAAVFGEALALWRGGAAEDLARPPELGARLAAIDEQRLMAVEDWVDARQRIGEDAGLVDELRRLTGEHPLRERLWFQLVLSLYRAGDVAAALAAYGRARAALVEHLGIDPGPELAALHRDVLSRDPALTEPRPAGPPPRPAVTALPAVPAPSAPRPVSPSPPWPPLPRELPRDTATLVGRDRELAALVNAVLDQGFGDRGIGGRGCDVTSAILDAMDVPSGARCPVVVTVHGPEGAGKSALAVRLATLLAGFFPDGQLFAGLRGTAADRPPLAPAEVLGRFLRALGLPDRRVPADEEEAAARFRSVTAGRRLLIVLDDATCEAQVQPLLPAAAGSTVVITGRPMLAALDGAIHVGLGPLALEDAVELLARCCGAGRVAADPAQLRRLALLCGRLPLALRIVAARLAAEPDRPLSSVADQVAAERVRLGALTFGGLTVPAPAGRAGR